MSSKIRRYRMRRRADAEQETRRRITESAVHLHRALGPARTTISAIAEHAGVRRSTVYRHFPDELSLFAACSAYWRAANPMPSIEAWQAVDDPDRRLRRALEELYEYYGRTASMLTSILRDAEMPTVRRTLAGYREYLAAARAALMKNRKEPARRRRRIAAAIGHALAFSTWGSLVLDEELSHEQAVDLMCRLVASAR